MRTDRQRTDKEQRIQLQRPLLSPADCRGEQANSNENIAMIQTDLSAAFDMVCHKIPIKNFEFYGLGVNL